VHGGEGKRSAQRLFAEGSAENKGVPFNSYYSRARKCKEWPDYETTKKKREETTPLASCMSGSYVQCNQKRNSFRIPGWANVGGTCGENPGKSLIKRKKEPPSSLNRGRDARGLPVRSSASPKLGDIKRNSKLHASVILPAPGGLCGRSLRRKPTCGRGRHKLSWRKKVLRDMSVRWTSV